MNTFLTCRIAHNGRLHVKLYLGMSKNQKPLKRI